MKYTWVSLKGKRILNSVLCVCQGEGMWYVFNTSGERERHASVKRYRGLFWDTGAWETDEANSVPKTRPPPEAPT